MLKNVKQTPIESPARGLNTSLDIFSLKPGESPGCMNVEFDADSTAKRYGTSTMNTVALQDTAGYAMFDFGIGIAPQTRRLVCSAGTGIYYSSDLGKTWVGIQTSQTAAFGHFAFVKNWIVHTNENYDVPLYWSGSAAVQFGSMSTLTPLCKFPIAHQGFFFLLNQTNNARGVYYIDENSMFTDAYENFSLPSDRNDEITVGFVLRKILYVSTKYKIFKLTYVGGSPDWAYVEVKNWGYVPKTVKKIQIPRIGEVIVGLDWTRRLRIFDGSTDEVLTTHIEENNDITEFYMKNINEEYIKHAWAENDVKEQLYRLYLPMGVTTTMSHCLVYNYRDQSFFPYDNQCYKSGVFAEDTAGGLHMMVCDYQGRIHQVDSGNTDTGRAVTDYYQSHFLYRDTPSKATRGHKVNLFFSVTSSGTLYFEDREDFSSVWNLRKTFNMMDGIAAVQTSQGIDIPTSFNSYQFKLSSSANSASPWRLNRADVFDRPMGFGKP